MMNLLGSENRKSCLCRIVSVTRQSFRLADNESTDTQEQLQNRTANAPLLRYVDSMRTHGHRAASIDPLDLLQREEVGALDPSRYGLSDMSRKYPINGIVWTSPEGPNKTSDEEWTLEKIIDHMRSVYVGKIAYEFMHSPSKMERLWFSNILEASAVAPSNVTDPEQKRRVWELLARSEVFDQFLQLKFPNLKRYGLEGGESMLPALDSLFAVASAGMHLNSIFLTQVRLCVLRDIAGIEHIILAMPHRGRLNLLTGLLDFSPAALFHKIKGGSEIPEELGYSGDVISHLGRMVSRLSLTSSHHFCKLLGRLCIMVVPQNL